MKRTFYVEVTQLVAVELDDDKLDQAFMEEFRQDFYPFDTIDDHAKHIAQLQARGVIELSPYSSEFIEGYGNSTEMGIAASVVDTDTEVVRVPA